MEYNGVKKIYEIKLTEEELKKILEEYFKQKNITEGKLIIKTTKETVGYYGKEDEIAKTRFYIENDIQFLNITKKAKIELSEEEIKSMLMEILSMYNITYISFKTGFEYRYQYEFKEPVFQGVNIHFYKKEKQNNNESIYDSPLIHADLSPYDPLNKGGYYEDWSLRRKF